ncbi:MAG: hypothetical protein ACJA1C_002872 [Crocinitomicaceae bacterium]|jgi:hypothetical protein
MMHRSENDKLKSVFKRFRLETPKFFRKLRNLGLVVTAVGVTLLASPIELPTTVLSIAGYLTVAGAVAIAMSQAVASDEFEM